MLYPLYLFSQIGYHLVLHPRGSSMSRDPPQPTRLILAVSVSRIGDNLVLHPWGSNYTITLTWHSLWSGLPHRSICPHSLHVKSWICFLAGHSHMFPTDYNKIVWIFIHVLLLAVGHLFTTDSVCPHPISTCVTSDRSPPHHLFFLCKSDNSSLCCHTLWLEISEYL